MSSLRAMPIGSRIQHADAALSNPSHITLHPTPHINPKALKPKLLNPRALKSQNPKALKP